MPENSSKAMGTLERERIVLMSPANLTIQNQPIEEGDRVKSGQLIIQLDTIEAEALVRQRQANLEQAIAHLSELEQGPRSEALKVAQAQLNQAKVTLLERNRQLDRTRTLFDQQQSTQAELDAAQTAHDLAEAQQSMAQQQWLELKAGTRTEQLDQAQATVDAARANLDSASYQLDQLSLKAPVDAVVDSLPWYTGERVPAGAQLATLLQSSAPYARVYLPANRLGATPVGKQVKVRIDGLETLLTGTVRHIRSAPAYTPYYALNERDRTRLMYLTDIEFSGDHLTVVEGLPTGRTLEVWLP